MQIGVGVHRDDLFTSKKLNFFFEIDFLLMLFCVFLGPLGAKNNIFFNNKKGILETLSRGHSFNSRKVHLERSELTEFPFSDSSLRIPLAFNLCLRYSGNSFSAGLCPDSLSGSEFFCLVSLPSISKFPWHQFEAKRSVFFFGCVCGGSMY